MAKVWFRPHQAEAIDKLRSGSILCGGVGTGKSMTALGFYYIRICDGVVFGDLEEGAELGVMRNPVDLYIITTARKRDTHEWEEELDRFGLRDECVQITIDSWNNIHKYSDVTGAFFIFDEQRVVGSGKWSKDFVHISRSGNQWILLSATPGDTWMDYIPVFLANGFYKNRTQFLKRHAVYSRYCTKYPKIERWLEPGHLEMLRRRIVVNMECEKVAEQHWEDILVDYDREAYKRVSEERWNIWEDEPIQDAAKACLLMRRVTGTGTTHVTVLAHSIEVNSRALEIFWIMMKKHPKVIVFYNYNYELDAIKDCFEKMRCLNLAQQNPYSVAEWNGNRHESLPDGERWAYLVQYTAGCEGWNCIETNCVIFFSQSYSYKQMTQAAGRIDRMNTSFTDLYYYVLKSDSSIDKAITRALKGKKNFNERLFWKD